MKFGDKKTRDFTLSYGERQESLSHPGLNRYRVMTDRRTELRQLARAQHYVLSRVKMLITARRDVLVNVVSINTVALHRARFLLDG